MTKLLVASGWHDGAKNTVEIVNLDGGNSNVICDDLPNLLVGVRGAAGRLLSGKTPIICGGEENACKCQAFQVSISSTF